MDWKWVLKTAGISVAVGIAAGVAAEKIISWKKRRDYDDALDDYNTFEDEWPDIPEGINEDDDVEDARLAHPEMYSKPDLSKLVDYTKYSKTDDGKEEEATELPGVEIISEEEFVRRTGNLDGYVSVTGTWFSQEGILAGWDSDLDEKDPSVTVGEKTVELFEDPEIEAVYVRNDILKVLFEIVRSNDPYELAMQEALVTEAADPSYSDEG